jgi:hypothetical protein
VVQRPVGGHPRPPQGEDLHHPGVQHHLVKNDTFSQGHMPRYVFPQSDFFFFEVFRFTNYQLLFLVKELVRTQSDTQGSVL